MGAKSAFICMFLQMLKFSCLHGTNISFPLDNAGPLTNLDSLLKAYPQFSSRPLSPTAPNHPTQATDGLCLERTLDLVKGFLPDFYMARMFVQPQVQTLQCFGNPHEPLGNGHPNVLRAPHGKSRSRSRFYCIHGGPSLGFIVASPFPFFHRTVPNSMERRLRIRDGAGMIRPKAVGRPPPQ